MRIPDLNKQAQRALWTARTEWPHQASMLPALLSMVGIAGVFFVALIYLLPQGNSPGIVLAMAGAIAGGVIMVYAVLRNPWWVLLGVVLIRPSIDQAATGIGNAAIALAVLLIGLAYLPLISRTEERATPFAWPPFAIAHVALLGWSFLGFAYMGHLSSEGWEAYLRQATVLIIILMAAREANTPARRRTALIIILLSNLPLAVMGTYGAVTHTGYRLEGDGANRLVARHLLEGPYMLAYLLAGGLVIGLVYFLTTRRPLVSLLSAAWCLWTLPLFLLCQTRSAWLGFGVACVVLIVLERRWAILAGLIVVVVLAVAVLGGTILHRIGTMSVEKERGGLWQGTWEIARGSPVVGYGPAEWVPVPQPDGSTVLTFVPGHNDYLRTAVWGGLPGPFIYLAFLWLLLRQAWLLARKSSSEVDRRVGYAALGVAIIQALGAFTGNCIALPLIMIENGFLFGVCWAGMLAMRETAPSAETTPRSLPLRPSARVRAQGSGGGTG